jgi:hypothetical protein
MLGAAVLLAAACIAAMLSSSAPSTNDEPMGERAIEVIADATHVYWTEVSVKEYDDEPAYISRASVRRRAHGGGAVEVLFDFERDAMRCTPRAIARLAEGLGFLCYREWVEGPFDASRYVHADDGLRSVPFDEGEPGRLATDGRHVFALISDRLVRLDPTSGARDELPALPAELGRPSSVDGVTGGIVVGRSRTTDRDFVWAAPADAGAPVEWLSTPRLHLGEVAVGSTGVVAVVGRYPEWVLTVIEGGSARELARSDTPFTRLRVDGARVYFSLHHAIRAADLATGAITTIVAADPAAPPAIGGGSLYWIEDGTVHRATLDPI